MGEEVGVVRLPWPAAERGHRNEVLVPTRKCKRGRVAEPLQHDFQARARRERPDDVTGRHGRQLHGLVRVGEEPRDGVVSAEDVSAVVVGEARVAVEAEGAVRAGEIIVVLLLPFRGDFFCEVSRAGRSFVDDLIAVEKRAFGNAFVNEIADDRGLERRGLRRLQDQAKVALIVLLCTHDAVANCDRRQCCACGACGVMQIGDVKPIIPAQRAGRPICLACRLRVERGRIGEEEELGARGSSPPRVSISTAYHL